MTAYIDMGNMSLFTVSGWFFCVRYKAELKRRETGAEERTSMIPASSVTPNEASSRLPDIDVDPDVVFLCRYVYDVKLHRILKNPPAHPVPM